LGKIGALALPSTPWQPAQDSDFALPASGTPGAASAAPAKITIAKLKPKIVCVFIFFQSL
jgi:hypothetical protein